MGENIEKIFYTHFFFKNFNLRRFMEHEIKKKKKNRNMQPAPLNTHFVSAFIQASFTIINIQFNFMNSVNVEDWLKM